MNLARWTDRPHGTALMLLLCLMVSGGCQRTASESDPFNISPVVKSTERISSTDRPEESPPLVFTSVAAAWGVQFARTPAPPLNYDDHVIVGSGCGIGDMDMDGDLDLLVPLTVSASTPLVSSARTSAGTSTGTSSVPSTSQKAGTQSTSQTDDAKRSVGGFAFFRQIAPGQFIDDTLSAGLDQCAGATGVAIADCNNDGFPDLLLTTPTHIELWMNDGNASFTNVTQAVGLQHSGWALSATWFDYDRDGWLDLFVTNYLNHAPQECTSRGGGRRDFCSPLLFDPTVDRLYRNLGPSQGVEGQSVAGGIQFQDVTHASGLAAHTTAGMQALAADLTGDGWPDIYVASDQRPNRLWVNRQDGTFVEEAGLRGCDVDFQGRPQASMGIALGIMPGRREPGFLVSHLSGEFHALYAAMDTGFIDDSRSSRLGQLTRPYTGFGVAICDLNSDGNAEVVTVNGRVMRPDGIDEHPDDFWQPYREPIQLLQSVDGVFREVTGAPFSSRHVARGLAIGDLDGDGDLDILISTIGEQVLVLRNDSPQSGRWLGLRAIADDVGSRSCPGARFSIQTSAGTLQCTLQPCQSYASTHQDIVHVGLGDASVESVNVQWPHGDQTWERFQPSPPVDASAEPSPSGFVYTVRRGAGTLIDSSFADAGQ